MTRKNPESPTPKPASPVPAERPKEIGEREGLDPVRYGDWEVGGKCVDF